MNAPAQDLTDKMAGIEFAEAFDDCWNVTVDGKFAGQVTRETALCGTIFRSGAGVREAHWNFSGALQAIAERARYQTEQVKKQNAAYAKYVASLRALTPEERQARIDALEAAKERLKYAPAHMDVIGRERKIDQQIAALKETEAA